MHANLLYNEDVCPNTTAHISPGQVGFMNGWGVFTTIRVYGGVMFAWERHWARMVKDARTMHVPMPESAQWLESKLYKLIAANQAVEATLRVAIIRNKGGMFETPNVEREFDLVAFTRDVAHWGTGVKLGVVPQGRHAANEFAGTKITSWSQNLTWYEQAHNRGLDEMVLLNERNEVSECTSANIFLVFDKRVYTPQLQSSGCLAGITRNVLLNDIQIPGLEISEHVLWIGDLQNADEIFITSTTREIMPVESIEGISISRQRTIIPKIQAAFTEYHREYTARAIQSRE